MTTGSKRQPGTRMANAFATHRFRSVGLVAVGLALTFALGGVALWSRTVRDSWSAGTTLSSELPGGLLFRQVALVHGRNGRTLVVRCVSGTTAGHRVAFVDLRQAQSPPLRDVLSGHPSGAVVNGGYFDAHGDPVGLMRVSGIEATPVTSKPLLSGVLIGGPGGPPRLVDRTSPEARLARNGRQCGPFLVGPHDTTGDRGLVAERTAVAFTGSRVALLTTTPATLDEVADVLVAGGAALGIPGVERAMNLDGGPSTGMAYRTADGVVGIEPRGRIVDAIILH